MQAVEIFVLIYLLVLGNEFNDILTLRAPKRLFLVAPFAALAQSSALFFAFKVFTYWISLA